MYAPHDCDPRPAFHDAQVEQTPAGADLIKRGERGGVVYSVPLLDRRASEWGMSQAGMRDGIRRDSVAVIVRIISSDNHKSSIVAGDAVSIVSE